jgi:chromosome transmission fidelity protein 1
VIIDEAHNLVDAILGIYSVHITLQQIKISRSQLMQYLQKFKSKLKGSNRVFVAQTVRVLDALISMGEQKLLQADKDGIIELQEVMSSKGADQVNLHELLRYLEQSKLARKVEGYTAFVADEDAKLQTKSRSNQSLSLSEDRSVPTLTQVQGFLLALTSTSDEGKLIFEKEGDTLHLKFLLLDPSFHFREIVESAKSVVLAGGTMSPMSDYVNQLFYYVPSSRLRTMSCNHVISNDHITVLPITRGHGGAEFEFTFSKRNSPVLIDETGHSLLAVSKVVPDGVVVFFPSYSYLETVLTRWKAKNGTKPTVFDQISRVKPVSSLSI